MKLLILGGTGDARLLAERLHGQGMTVVYSVAGLVRVPVLPFSVISGGFSSRGGLTAFLQREAITAVLDATHAFAEHISQTAAKACSDLNLAYWRYQSQPWQPVSGDHWLSFQRWDALLAQLEHYRSVFFTVGRLPGMTAEWIQSHPHIQCVIRSAVAVDDPLQRLHHVHHLQQIGPFSLQDEIDCFERYRIDSLVCKNSGGDATAAKLTAARSNHVPVLMLERPELPVADQVFHELDDCEAFVLQQQNEKCVITHEV